MSKRKHVDDQPMSDAEYKQFLELQHYDAESLRALAMWLKTKKKNAALMKAVTVEMGRNARHMARAVDYFPPYFEDIDIDAPGKTASEYLMLFEYAKLKKEDAMNLFRAHHFGTPLYQLREVVSDARRNGHGAKRETPKRDDAPILAVYERFKHLDSVLVECGADYQAGDDPFHVTAHDLWMAIRDYAALPAVASVLARRAKAEGK